MNVIVQEEYFYFLKGLIIIWKIVKGMFYIDKDFK